MKCNQIEHDEMCGAPAEYRYTWPGKNEAGICTQHASQLRTVASAIGLQLQFVEVTKVQVRRWEVETCADCPFILCAWEDGPEICGRSDPDHTQEVNPLEVPPVWCDLRAASQLVVLKS